MVLNIISFILFLGIHTESVLLIKYEKQINKSITKELGLESTELVSKKFSRGELYEIKNNKNSEGYLLIAEVAACRLGGCSSFEKINNNESAEYFDMFLICDSSKNIISISILDYYSEYGYEITSKKYLKKFKQKNICEFSEDTDGIDAISGATISSYALEAIIGTVCDAL